MNTIEKNKAVQMNGGFIFYALNILMQHVSAKVRAIFISD